jgi:hypothetical protein
VFNTFCEIKNVPGLYNAKVPQSNFFLSSMRDMQHEECMRDVSDNNLPEGSNSEKDLESSTRGVSDWIKKTLATGTSVEPFFSLLAQAEKTRKGVMRSVARELRGFLNGIEIQDILLKVLSNAKLEVHATIRLIPHQKVIKKSKLKIAPRKSASKKIASKFS